MLDERGNEMLACLLAIADDIDAGLLPSTSSSSCSFHGDHSVSGCASQAGFGRLPAVEVGNSFFMVNVFYFG
jgi:hypothetical protein